MSEAQTDTRKDKLHKLPLIIKKESLKSGPSSNYGLIFRRSTGSIGNVIREDVIYKARDDDFLKGKYPNLLIVNILNVARNSSRTTATYNASNSSIVKLTSDTVVTTIGQENYDQLFAALCSVISQELKVKGILSLLSCKGATEAKKYSTIETQTYESSFNELMRNKQRKRNGRNKIKSYIVKDHIKSSLKKVVIHPCDLNLIKSEDIKVEVDQHINNNCTPLDQENRAQVQLNINKTATNIIGVESVNTTLLSNIKRSENVDLFPELKLIVDEDSNISDVGSIGNLSIGSDFSLSNIETNAKSILNHIDQHTEEISDLHEIPPPSTSTIIMVDGSAVTVRGNPDPFHLDTPDILRHLVPSDQKKIILHQAYIDWKYCLQQDEDDNLPIHTAVRNNDVGLLKRQCLMLKSRNETVDIAASGNMTALQMAILQDHPDCTSVLLEQGADLLVRDEESRTTLHLAAEIGSKHVEALLAHCGKNARQILKEDVDLWKPELELKSDMKLAQYLLMRINTMCDNQGYTPLMLASKIGNFSAVDVLVKAAPNAVNIAMPTCGDTALYLAVSAACFEATNRGDKTDVPEHFKKTIEILVENGADPSLDNSSGSNVNILLSEFSIVKLTMLIANKLTAVKYFAGDVLKNCDSFMLVKDNKGKINIKEIKPKHTSRPVVNKTSQRKLSLKQATNVEDKIIVKYNSNYKTNPVPKPVENVDNNDTANVIEKPVILNNMPVVTKIVTFGNTSEKPILVKGISSAPGSANKGLRTQLTTSTPKQNVAQTFIPIGKKCIAHAPPKYLKILPKPVVVAPMNETAVAKKTPIILRTAPVKRPNRDNSPTSANKIPKTQKEN